MSLTTPLLSDISPRNNNSVINNNQNNNLKSKLTSTLVLDNLDFPKSELSWNQRAIKELNQFDTVLDDWMPDWILQQKIDELGSFIEDQFSGLTTFNTWLRSNGNGGVYSQLATFLAKLPLRAAYNIVTLLYKIVSGILFTAVHPLKSLNNVAKLIVSLAHAMTQPETWSKIGIGMIGGGLGQALILGNPVPVIGMIIGSALVVAGLTFGALKAAITAEEGEALESALDNVCIQIEQLPEAFLTGLFMGMLIGGIRRACASDERTQNHRIQQQNKAGINYDPAKAIADKFIQEHHLPQYDSISIDSSGNIVLEYAHSDIVFKYPQLTPSGTVLADLKLVIPTRGEAYFIRDIFNSGWDGDSHFIDHVPISKFGI